MSLERDFLQMSTQRITIDPLSTASNYGAPSYSTSGSSGYFAYIEPGARTVVSARGVEEVTTAMLYVLSSSAGISVQDRVTLPDGRQPKILRSDIIYDERGQHHLEVAIQ